MSWMSLLPATALLLSLAADAAPAPARRPAAAPSAAAPSYAGRDDARALGRAIASAQGLDADWVLGVLAQARFQASVTRLVMPPPAGSPKNWAAYRARMVDAPRAAEGLRFWQANERWLTQAEARWGVPPEMVVAIVGVETYYGRIRGNYRILDALATLSLDFPSGRSDRSGFYRDELAAFLAWCHAEQREPTSVKGSYAGAIGLPQFMPSSIRRYAIDFDGDGRIDLEHNPADVVGSVARYFAEFGWERGLPTHYGVQPPTDTSARATLLAPDIQPSFSAQRMAELGAVLDEAGRAHTGPLALVELQNGDAASSHVAGTRNFWVVTRYNWSSYYAMAVIDLAREIKRLRPPPPQPPASAPLQ
jgi:membrane-bound lytic murein transglycosylase B